MLIVNPCYKSIPWYDLEIHKKRFMNYTLKNLYLCVNWKKWNLDIMS